MKPSLNANPASFRDPSGFVFSSDGIIYRQVNKVYKDHYDLFTESGLYKDLTSSSSLIEHQEAEITGHKETQYKIIQPKKIPFISYPYEWCFSMLKSAALLTLNIQKTCLEYDMSLKDASAYNIQFLEGKPVLIDTLSFEKYEEGKPWIAYKQFTEHFLTPLALMSLTDIRLNRLSTLFLDGIPLDLASSLLPFSSRFKLSLLLHIFAHSSSQKKFSRGKLTGSQLHRKFSRRAFLGLIDNLESAINNLSWNPKKTPWAGYYEKDNNNYHGSSFTQKAEFVRKSVNAYKPKVVWDIGANSGFFSRIAGSSKALVVSFDSDFGALETNYLEITKKKEKNILPLFCDFTNPNPAIGWANRERLSLVQRGPADIVLALALIHHLSISQNIPLPYIASFFSQISKFLVIEFVPKDDSQVKKLLLNRKDIFPDYNREYFEKTFSDFFQIKKISPITKSRRTMYFMERKT